MQVVSIIVMQVVSIIVMQSTPVPYGAIKKPYLYRDLSSSCENSSLLVVTCHQLPHQLSCQASNLIMGLW